MLYRIYTVVEKYGGYSKQYNYVDKGEKQPVVCECGKSITKPYWYKNHLATVYHNKHSYR